MKIKVYKDRQEAYDYLSSLSVSQLINGYADLIMEYQEYRNRKETEDKEREKKIPERKQKISLTFEQFTEHFSIKGESGVGRKPVLTAEDKEKRKQELKEYQRRYYQEHKK